MLRSWYTVNSTWTKRPHPIDQEIRLSEIDEVQGRSSAAKPPPTQHPILRPTTAAKLYSSTQREPSLPLATERTEHLLWRMDTHNNNTSRVQIHTTTMIVCPAPFHRFCMVYRLASGNVPSPLYSPHSFSHVSRRLASDQA